MNNLSPGRDIRTYGRVVPRRIVRRQRQSIQQTNDGETNTGENNNMEQENEEDMVPDLAESRLQTQTTLDTFIINNTHA